MTVTRFIQHRVTMISLCAGDKVSQRKNILVPADKAYNGRYTVHLPRVYLELQQGELQPITGKKQRRRVLYRLKDPCLIEQ